jgi:hypothetical protein
MAITKRTRDGRASVLERCPLDPVKKDAPTALICQVLALVSALARVRLNEVLRTLNKEQLQQRLQVDALLSLAVLRLPMVCKEVYANLMPSMAEMSMLCFRTALQRSSLLQLQGGGRSKRLSCGYEKKLCSCHRWWFAYDDGMSNLLRKMGASGGVAASSSSTRQQTKQLKSYFEDASACAQDQLCGACDKSESVQPIESVPPVVRKWTKVLAAMQTCSSVHKSHCRRNGCCNAVRACKSGQCLLTLCTSNSKSSTFLDYLSVVGGLGLRTAPLCSCFCSNECLQRVRSSLPLALSTRQLHAWKRLDHPMGSATSSKTRMSLHNARPQARSDGQDPLQEVTTMLQQALERNHTLKDAGRRMWEDVPLSLPDREAIHRMYIRCYNVDAGVLYILQLMHGLQTGWSQLRQVSGAIGACGAKQALDIALACYENASKSEPLPLLQSVQMSVPHAYITCIRRWMQEIAEREYRLVALC